MSKETLPSWLVRPQSMYIKGQRVFVYGSPDHADHSVFTVHATVGTTIPNVMVTDALGAIKYISPQYLYISTHQTATTTAVTVKKNYAKDFQEFTADHEYMIKLLTTPARKDVIDLVMEGVDLNDYNLIIAPKYYVMVPKEPESLYLPMLMAHTDIQAGVKTPTMDNLEYDPKTQMFGSSTGLGADDRAGCYAINRVLKAHPKKFIVALFDEEEIGCVGSREFANSAHFADVNRLASCYISIDRRRGHDGKATIATYGYDNKDLFDIIKIATGRDTVFGSSTDCKVLSGKSYDLPASPGQTKLACFNMSCGYLNEHTSREVLYFKELQDVVTDIDNMVSLAPELWEEAFRAKKAEPTYGYGYGSYYSRTTPTTTKTTGKGKTKTKDKEPVKTLVTYDEDDVFGDWSIDTIDIDGISYDEQDLTTLLWLYKQQYGCDYEFKDASNRAKEFEKNTYVRLDPKCAVGQTYGGKELTYELYLKIKKCNWLIKELDDDMLQMELVSDDKKLKAVNIPYDMMVQVTLDDPFIESL